MRWISQRTGSQQSAGAWRNGEYRKRVCNQKIWFQFDELGVTSAFVGKGGYTGRRGLDSSSRLSRETLKERKTEIRLVILGTTVVEETCSILELGQREMEIILAGGLINYYRHQN